MTRAGWLLCLSATMLGCSSDGPIALPHGLDGGGGGSGSGSSGRDAGVPRDGGSLPDAGAPPDAGQPFPDGGLVSADAGGDPNLLSTQGVYGDFARRTIPSDAITYDVRWPLWVDGATKRRWLLLPGGAQIDNRDQDHWRIPIGARLVKEFTRSGILVETRILERTGPNAADYTLRTFVWNAAQTEATLTTNGATDVNGTGHDVPQASDCWTCHEGEPGMALGLSALQLPPATLAQLSRAGRLTAPIPAGTLGPTGASAAVAALGYLHGNCGHCHNPGGFAAQFNNQTLRLDTAIEAAEQEPGWRTTVGVPVQGRGLGATLRVDPGNPDNTAILRRMSIRGDGQMPFVGTNTVDAAGVATVRAWVMGM